MTWFTVACNGISEFTLCFLLDPESQNRLLSSITITNTATTFTTLTLALIIFSGHVDTV